MVDILFEGLNLENVLIQYKNPSSKDASDFIRQTKGRITNEILIFLDKPPDPNCKITYNGPLTPAQQLEILMDITDNHNFNKVNPDITYSDYIAKEDNYNESIPKYEFEYTYRSRYKK